MAEPSMRDKELYVQAFQQYMDFSKARCQAYFLALMRDRLRQDLQQCHAPPSPRPGLAPRLVARLAQAVRSLRQPSGRPHEPSVGPVQKPIPWPKQGPVALAGPCYVVDEDGAIHELGPIDSEQENDDEQLNPYFTQA